jgi:hypothetical protein
MYCYLRVLANGRRIGKRDVRRGRLSKGGIRLIGGPLWSVIGGFLSFEEYAGSLLALGISDAGGLSLGE